MPVRIRVRVVDNIKRREQEIIDAIVNVIPEIVILNAYETREGALLVIENLDHVYELLNGTSTEKLREAKLQVSPPEWYFPEKTVFVSRVRHYITTLDTEIIEQEINRVNNLQVEKVFIIQNQRRTRYGNERRRTMKITFRNKENADHALLNGIHLFNTKIATEDISKERYSPITQCYICFQHDHHTSACRKEIQLCSICGKEHHFRQCPTPNNPTCLNCGGKHLAVSKGCKIYQALVTQALEARRQAAITPIRNSPNYNISSQRDFPNLPQPQNTAVTAVNNSALPTAVNNAVRPATGDTTNTETNITPEKILENDLKKEAINNYAIMKANGNEDLYIFTINKFMEANGMTPIIIPNLDIIHQTGAPSTDSPIVVNLSGTPQPTDKTNEEVELPFSLHTPEPLSPISPKKKKAMNRVPTHKSQASLNLQLSPITEDNEMSALDRTPENRETTPVPADSPISMPQVPPYNQGAIPKVKKTPKTRKCRSKAHRKLDTETESDRDYDSDSLSSTNLSSLRSARMPSKIKQARSISRKHQIEHRYELRKAVTKAVREEIEKIRLINEASEESEENEDNNLHIVLSEQEEPATNTGYHNPTQTTSQESEY